MVDLKDALGFTYDDLVANRQGRLTRSQRRELRGKRLEPVLLLLLFTLVGTGFILSHSRSIALGFTIDTMIGFVFFVIVLVTAVYLGLTWQKITWDLRDNAVNSVSGKVEIAVTAGGRSQVWYRLTIGKTQFRIPEGVRDGFVHGHRYRLYYVPNSKIILSAEPMRRPDVVQDTDVEDDSSLE